MAISWHLTLIFNNNALGIQQKYNGSTMGTQQEHQATENHGCFSPWLELSKFKNYKLKNDIENKIWKLELNISL
jgi:hypothetical protein